MNEMSQLFDALAFAADKHRMQRRKDAEASPYINHPIALARVLSNEVGMSETIVLSAALLHDTIEDTNTTEEDLRARFGETVTRIVVEVTDDKSLEKHKRKALQIEHAPRLSREAKLVKLADKICNLRDVAETPPAISASMGRSGTKTRGCAACTRSSRPSSILHTPSGRSGDRASVSLLCEVRLTGLPCNL